MNWLYSTLLGYIFGSIPTAWIICKVFYGINILECGSKNMGSTNVYRTVGSRGFAATLGIDVLKGMVPVLMAGNLWQTHPHLVFAAATGAMLGHSFSFWVKFKGGKGVATGLGVFIALSGNQALYALGTFLLALLLTRMVSVSSIVAATALPFYLWQGEVLGEYNPYITGFSIIIALFVIIKHKTNIQRLIKGTESKLPFFAPKDSSIESEKAKKADKDQINMEGNK